jgi:hypothetical protein
MAMALLLTVILTTDKRGNVVPYAVSDFSCHKNYVDLESTGSPEFPIPWTEIDFRTDSKGWWN